MISDERDWKGKILKILEELENGKGKRNFFFCLFCAMILNGKFCKRRKTKEIGMERREIS